ncbi:MAG: hypothetical protein ACRDQ4_19175 [Pseudonocardiaceae bacterium]
MSGNATLIDIDYSCGEQSTLPRGIKPDNGHPPQVFPLSVAREGHARTATLETIVTPNICSVRTDVVLYPGREVDLDGFLTSLAGRQCRSTPLTLITAADIEVLLRELQLSAAKLTVVYAGTSDAQALGARCGGNATELRCLRPPETAS